MPVSREQVLWAFRAILGREPESEVTVVLHMKCVDFPALREALIASNEFAKFLAAKGIAPKAR